MIELENFDCLVTLYQSQHCSGATVAKINKAVTEMTNNFNLDVDEDDIEELLQVVPEELTNEWLELEQKHIAEEEAREKQTTGKEKEEPPRRFTIKCLVKAF